MLIKVIRKAIKEVFAFLSDPYNLPKWTVHRALYQKGGNWYEIRTDRHGGLSDVAMTVTPRMANPYRADVTFSWKGGNTVTLELTATRKGFTHIAVSFPKGLNPKHKKIIEDLIAAEMDILQSILEKGNTDNIPQEHWYKLQSYHLKMYR